MESPAIRPALAAAERLKDILASPFRVMQDVAERVADKLVPDPLSDDKTKLSPAVALYAAQPELSAAPSRILQRVLLQALAGVVPAAKRIRSGQRLSGG